MSLSLTLSVQGQIHTLIIPEGMSFEAFKAMIAEKLALEEAISAITLRLQDKVMAEGDAYGYLEQALGGLSASCLLGVLECEVALPVDFELKVQVISQKPVIATPSFGNSVFGISALVSFIGSFLVPKEIGLLQRVSQIFKQSLSLDEYRLLSVHASPDIKKGRRLQKLAVNGRSYFAILQDKLYSWGDNMRGKLGLGHTKHQPTPAQVALDLAVDDKVVQLIVDQMGSIYYVVIERANGQVQIYSWGRNYSGPLGLGHTEHQLTPAQIALDLAAGDKVAQLVTRRDSTYVVIERGNDQVQVYSWGNNDGGQLGLGHTEHQLTPAQVALDLAVGDKVTQLVSSAGDSIFAVVKRGNGQVQVYSWGDNEKGQLGLGHKDNQSISRLIVGLNLAVGDKVAQLVSPGCSLSIFAVVKRSNGQNQVYSWGNNDGGQLGLGHIEHQLTPAQITLNLAVGDKVMQLVFNHAVIERGSGQVQVYSWDRLDHDVNQSIPRLIVGLNLAVGDKVAQLVSSVFSTYTVIERGNGQVQVYSWGNNNYGQLGLGRTDASQSNPTRVALDLAVDDRVAQLIGSGGSAFLVIESANNEVRIYCCGNNACGQLGLGNKQDRNRFTQLKGIAFPLATVGNAHQLQAAVVPEGSVVSVEPVGSVVPLDAPSSSSSVSVAEQLIENQIPTDAMQLAAAMSLSLEEMQRKELVQTQSASSIEVSSTFSCVSSLSVTSSSSVGSTSESNLSFEQRNKWLLWLDKIATQKQKPQPFEPAEVVTPRSCMISARPYSSA